MRIVRDDPACVDLVIQLGKRLVKTPAILANENGKITFYRQNTTLADVLRYAVPFNGSCLYELCSNENETLRMYVNGEETEMFGEYVLKHKDEVLLYYGPK